MANFHQTCTSFFGRLKDDTEDDTMSAMGAMDTMGAMETMGAMDPMDTMDTMDDLVKTPTSTSTPTPTSKFTSTPSSPKKARHTSTPSTGGEPPKDEIQLEDVGDALGGAVVATATPRKEKEEGLNDALACIATLAESPMLDAH